VRDAFKAMPIKTNKKDAGGIAQLMRLGWFRPVYCRSLPAQEVQAMLTARKLVQTKLHDIEMSLRGIFSGFGLKVGHTTPRTFEPRIRELVEGHPILTTIADALLVARSVLHREFQGFERRLRSLARGDDRARLLMSAPGVGVLVSLTYASAIDDPGGLKHSRQVGAHFGMTPKPASTSLLTAKRQCGPSRWIGSDQRVSLKILPRYRTQGEGITKQVDHPAGGWVG
jgi:transposase